MGYFAITRKVTIGSIHFALFYNAFVSSNVAISQPFFSAVDASIANQLLSCYAIIQKRSWMDKDGEIFTNETLNAVKSLLSQKTESHVTCNMRIANKFLENIGLASDGKFGGRILQYQAHIRNWC